jgi:hypothetical protein
MKGASLPPSKWWIAYFPSRFGRLSCVAAGAWALVTGALMAGCGANQQAVYEGDVRFEHCMALDATPEVKSQIRRACWSEWVAFYTYGQTRDRVVHAQLRVKQLNGVSDFVAPQGPTSTAPAPQPQPAPQPASASAADPGAKGLAPLPSANPSKGACASGCRATGEDCARECTSPSCRKECSAVFRACLTGCE